MSYTMNAFFSSRVVHLGRRVAIASCAVFFLSAGNAQTQSPMSIAVKKTCDVMAGKRKLDGQTLQYLMMMQGGIDVDNPIEMVFQQQVVRTCPRDYIAFEQRKRAHNPYAAGSLVKKGGPLINGGQN
jgi:hypothetical protein